MSDIFITGNSNGLGLGLTRLFLDKGDNVFSASRSVSPTQHKNLQHSVVDLSDLSRIETTLKSLLPKQLDLVILNAGVLGKIEDLADTTMDQTKTIMDTNVWSNKVIVDWLIHQQIKVAQIIFISSGASVNGNRGWGIYSISKASINMMAKLYAAEMPETHITAYAPGIIQTKMQDYLCNDVDTDKFKSVSFLTQAYQTKDMPDIDSAARNIAESFERCKDFESGSFLDIRDLSESR